MKSILILSLVLACLSSCAVGDEVIPMEPFEPMKGIGVWYVHQRNRNLMQKTSGAKCLMAEVEPDAAGGDLYKLEIKWKDPSLGDLDVTLHIVDDKVHPAQYFFQNDEHRIALSVLGTDYDTYLVGHGMLGLRATYFVAFRKMPFDDSVMAEVKKILEKNKVTAEFDIIDHSSC